MHALAALGRPAPSPDVLREFIGPPLQESFARLGLSTSDVSTAVTAYRARFDDVGLFENRVYDDVVPMLRALRGRGFRLAVATSKPTVFAARIVEHFGLSSWVEHVVGSELSGERRHKADVIAHALTLLGVAASPDVVMVGDRKEDILGARECGVSSVGALWGYGSREELLRADPTWLAETPSAVAALTFSVDSPPPGCG